MKDEKLLEEAEKQVKDLEDGEAVNLCAMEEIEETVNVKTIANDIQSSYNFLLGYGKIMKILLFVVAGFYVLSFLFSIGSEQAEGSALITASAVIGLIVTGLFLDAIMKWFAYMLKNVHEINMKIK